MRSYIYEKLFFYKIFAYKETKNYLILKEFFNSSILNVKY